MSSVPRSQWAIAGGAPEFAIPIPVGQLYFPSWERYEAAMRGIFARQYYTNHGPLARQLEERLADFLGVRHVVCVTNATIGLMMAAKALELRGRVIVPAFTFSATVQSLTWAGIEPQFCDIDPHTHQICLASARSRLAHGVSAILGVNLWGGACSITDLQALADQAGVRLFFDSAHAFGCRIGGRAIGNFGELEVFSFHATKILSATEGGCVCTNDDLIAARLRNIRSSYGAGPAIAVPLTSNGRLSEAQAAIALLSLEDFPANRARNQTLHGRYRSRLGTIAGLKVLEASGVDETNYQYLVIDVDPDGFGLTRDELLATLKAENVNVRRYFHPGMHRVMPYCNTLPQFVHALPATDLLCSVSIQLPLGALVGESDVDRICELIRAAHADAPSLKALLGNR